MFDEDAGHVCGGCGAFMSGGARPFHSCTTFRRRQQVHVFGGVVVVDGRRYVSQMDTQGNLRERERRPGRRAA